MEEENIKYNLKNGDYIEIEARYHLKNWDVCIEGLTAFNDKKQKLYKNINFNNLKVEKQDLIIEALMEEIEPNFRMEEHLKCRI